MPVCKQNQDDLTLICDAIRPAGELAMSYFGKSPAHWQKADSQPVSEADIAVNQYLYDALRTPRPDYGWLSEETEDDNARLGKERVWIIDPIDGTKAFLAGQPHFTISIAVVENNRPTAAAVYNPATEELYTAALGGGAFRNHKPIRISTMGELHNSRICAFEDLFSHPRWADLWPPMHVENRNSVAYRLALVADGQFDAMLAMNKKSDWDLAAGDLIVHEAGGVMHGLEGAALQYNTRQTDHQVVMAGSAGLVTEFHHRIARIKQYL